MSYPNGKREKLVLVWLEGKHSFSSNIPLQKGKVTFEGSPRHCAEQALTWLYQKKFIDPVSVAFWAFKKDFTLFGRMRKMEEDALIEEAKVNPNILPNK